MSDLPLVTVLIPARNEEADIQRCLEAVLAQDYPHDRMEIVLVDGGSTDKTKRCAFEVLGLTDVEWRVIDNPIGSTPSNLNAGLAVASGVYLCRVDARSIIPRDYVRRCIEVLSERPDVVVTGGAQVAVAIKNNRRLAGIARALNNRVAMGGSRYRSGSESGATDTTYLGAFRTEQLRTVGGWDEYFETNQDYELNRRLGRTGVVWFDATLSVGYVPRSTLVALWRQYHRFGRWKVRYWRRAGDPPQLRQWLLMGGAASSAVGTVAIILLSKRRLRSTVALASSAVVGLLAIDTYGMRAPSTPIRHAYGAASILVLSLAWLSGVIIEFFRPVEISSNVQRQFEVETVR